VKKTISIIVLAAALLASLTVFVCYNPENEEVEVDGKKYKGYVNPLDKDGDNYLYGLKNDADYEKRCTGPNKDGVALIFTDDSICKPQCDPVIPKIELVGPQKVTINSQQVTEFRKWMHFDGGSWDNLITYEMGAGGNINPTTREPCLKDGNGCKSFTDAEKNSVPRDGDYVIQYRVIKIAVNGDTVCNGVIPQAIKERVLTCTTFVAPDTATPVITLSGDKNTEFRVGITYQDRGVTLSIGELDSIIVKGTNSGNGYEQKLKTKPISATAIITPTNAAAGFTYSITYYASYKGRAAVPVVRTVTVIAAVTSNVPAVIVLENYKHKLANGTVAEYPDTMLLVGQSNSDYKEKGVAEVYYMKDGEKVPLDKSLVTTKNQSPFITGQSSAGARAVNYDIEAGNGYAAKNVKRNVFLVDNLCEPPDPQKPTVTATGASQIPAGTPWDYANSWSVISNDAAPNNGTGFKYFIHFNGLDPNNPKPGSYDITYVGLGKCGAKTELPRTIVVK